MCDFELVLVHKFLLYGMLRPLCLLKQTGHILQGEVSLTHVGDKFDACGSSRKTQSANKDNPATMKRGMVDVVANVTFFVSTKIHQF